jgi:hypothetical protein
MTDQFSSYPVLQFLASHPWVSFLMSWPVGLVIVSVCWSLTRVLDNTVTLFSNMVLQLLNFVLLMVRGYPSGPVVPPSSSGVDDDVASNDGSEHEGKTGRNGDGPLAG